MTDNERDTHFQGFAKLLLADLKECDNEAFLKQEKYDSYQQRVTRLVAQRAYDLVAYALYKARRGCSMEHIDDLTSWPDLPDSE